MAIRPQLGQHRPEVRRVGGGPRIARHCHVHSAVVTAVAVRHRANEREVMSKLGQAR